MAVALAAMTPASGRGGMGVGAPGTCAFDLGGEV
jgi:hypothetical protein